MEKPVVDLSLCVADVVFPSEANRTPPLKTPGLPGKEVIKREEPLEHVATWAVAARAKGGIPVKG